MANTILTTEMFKQAMEQMFDEEYEKWEDEYIRMDMPRRGRYRVWKGVKMVADRIKHRKQALALIKLLKGNEENE